MNQESVGGAASEAQGGGGTSAEVVVRLVQEARACWERKAWAESERLLAEGIRLAEAEADPNAIGLAWVLRHSAWLATRMERYDASVADYRRALAIYEAEMAPEYADAAVSTRIELAASLFELGRATNDRDLARSAFREADEQAMRAIESRDASGRVDLEAADLLVATAWRRYWVGRYADAEPLLVRALQLLDRLVGPADSRTTSAARNLAMTYEHGGFDVDAAPYYQMALVGLEEHLPELHHQVREALARLAKYLDVKGRVEEASTYYDRLVTLLLNNASEVDWEDCHWYLDDCGQYLRDASRLDELEELEHLAEAYDVTVAMNRQSLAAIEDRHGRDSVEYAAALQNLAHCLGFIGKVDEAVATAAEALVIIQSRLGTDDPAVNEARDLVESVRIVAAEQATQPRRPRRLGREAPKLFERLAAPWADEHRENLIQCYLAAAADDESQDDPTGAFGAVTALTFMADADEQWPFILDLIAAAPDDPDVLQAIAAGPLEGLLGRFDAEVIDRVEAEAERDPRFRRILSGVWKHGMSDAVWARVRKIQKSVPDALPEAHPFEET